MRSFSRIGSTLSAAGLGMADRFVKFSMMHQTMLGSSMSMRNAFLCGSRMSILDELHLGSSMSLRNFSRFGDMASVLDFLSMGRGRATHDVHPRRRFIKGRSPLAAGSS